MWHLLLSHCSSPKGQVDGEPWWQVGTFRQGSLSIMLPTSQEMAWGKTSLWALGNYLQTLLYSRPVGILVIGCWTVFSRHDMNK